MIDLPINVREIIGAAGGLAGVGEAGKISPMPNAADVGAADVELLTWTPRIAIGSAEPTGIVYAKQQGWGIRVGKLVYLQANITLSSKGSVAEDATVCFRGMPYAPSANYNAAIFGWVAGAARAGTVHGELAAGNGGYVNTYYANTNGDGRGLLHADLTDSFVVEGLSMTYIIN